MNGETARPRVLVCDDDAAHREIFREILIDEGYDVTVEAVLCESMDDVIRLAPDLIVLDLIFDGQPAGLDFLRLLKAAPATKSIPVLVCTAAGGLTEEIQRQLTEWECASVTKPFDIDDLVAAVRECLDKAEIGV
jgi:two-component system response regulator MprA